MNIVEFKKASTVEKISTVNENGVAGKVGTKYTYKHMSLFEGKWFYRHQEPSVINTYYYEGRVITKVSFIKLLKAL